MSTQLTVVCFEKSLKVIINPLKYWAIKPDTLFFTKQRYESSACNANLMIKIDDKYCLTSNLDIIELVDQETIVYLVQKITEIVNIKMKFKDLYIGQYFTHELLSHIMRKIENERYSYSYYEARLLSKGSNIFSDRIDPKIPLTETWIEVN
ncbi:hypothetical protein [Nostoc sp.]|uniref:hypothetical protein n=1 Tax=Nostoc sp. TaxID=1180 RepID=UPI002FF50A37